MAVFRAPITPGMRWWSGTGVATPAAGYLLFQYLAGGATPQATFTDAVGNVANANPIVLNANGGLLNDLWFTGGVTYRLLLTDASLFPLPGNPVWDVDNLVGVDDPAFSSPNTGEWITGGAATWIASAATIAGTQFSMVGDTRAFYQPNRRVRLVSGTGDLPGTITRATFAAGLTTITVSMQQSAAGVFPVVGNPITGLYYALENTGSSSGLPAGIPSRVLELGAPRYPLDGSVRTGIDLYGPTGSNLVAFTVPPNVVAAAGGGGNQIRTAAAGPAGALEFNKANHGRISGEVVQLTTSNALPGGTALVTSYIVLRFDANNFGLYAVPAGWQFEQPYLDAVAVTGGLAWGNPLQFINAGVGNQTVTPGFVAPNGVTRVYANATGGGGGGGGGNANTNGGGGGGSGGSAIGFVPVVPGAWIAAVCGLANGGNTGASAGNAGTAGGNSTFSTLTGGGGGGGATAGVGGTAGTATGGAINLGGGHGMTGQTAVGNTFGGKGAANMWGDGGTGGIGGTSLTAYQGSAFGSGGGGGGATAGGGGQAGTGNDGVVIIQW